MEQDNREQESQPRYCHQCGWQLEPGAIECPRCGINLDSDVVAPYSTSPRELMNLEYMGFWVRLLAYLVDMVVIVAVLAILSRFLGPIGMVFGYALGLGYFVVFTSMRGQTLGKMALGLQVVDSTGNIPSLGTTLLREVVGRFVSGLLFNLGYVWAAWDPEKRGWHDHIARTHVVRKQRERSF